MSTSNTTRAFLLGGPADGRVLLLEGSPFDIRIPEPPDFSRYMGPDYGVEPLKVVSYVRRRSERMAASDHEVTVYAFEEPSRRRPVVFARSAQSAMDALDAAGLRSDRHRAIVISGPYDEHRLRGLVGSDVVLVPGYGYTDVIGRSREIQRSIDVLTARGAVWV